MKYRNYFDNLVPNQKMIFSGKIYATLILKQFDWFKKLNNQ